MQMFMSLGLYIYNLNSKNHVIACLDIFYHYMLSIIIIIIIIYTKLSNAILIV